MNEENTNCLEGMQCPECKSLEPFAIGCHCMLEVTDDGTDIAEGYDIEWMPDDICICKACGYVGKVKDYTIEEEV